MRCNHNFFAFFTQFVEVRGLIRRDSFWDNVDLCLRVLMPALVALRCADGKKGSSMALTYNHMLQLTEHYGKPIRGLSDAIRKKVGATVPVLTIVTPTHASFFLLVCMSHTAFSSLIVHEFSKDSESSSVFHH
jgi:hypothetical protein